MKNHVSVVLKNDVAISFLLTMEEKYQCYLILSAKKAEIRNGLHQKQV